MNSHRKTAITVGVMLLLGFSGIVTVVLMGPVIAAPDYLVRAVEQERRLVLAALFQIIMAVGCAGIAIGLFPVLKRYSEMLALGAVGFRLVEAALFVVAAIGVLLLPRLGEAYVLAGAPPDSHFLTAGSLLLSACDWANLVFAPIAFGLGALLYYYAFYRTGLVPRWLAVWGIIGIVLHLAVALSKLFGAELATMEVPLELPIALQELVLAVWLIARGFNPVAVASFSAASA